MFRLLTRQTFGSRKTPKASTQNPAAPLAILNAFAIFASLIVPLN